MQKHKPSFSVWFLKLLKMFTVLFLSFFFFLTFLFIVLDWHRWYIPVLDLFLETVSTLSHILFVFTLPLGCRLCGRRSHGTLRGHGAAKRTLSFMSWPRCCHCRAPLPASWTRHPSSGSPSATWRWGTLPTRVTRRGTCAWIGRHPTPLSKVGGGQSWSCV